MNVPARLVLLACKDLIVCWVVVRDEARAMLGFLEHSPHNSRHSCHLVWDILNPSDTADKKSYVAL